MDNQNIQNQNKYDISKSNFFANIDSEDKKNNEQQKQQNTEYVNTPISNLNQPNIPISQNIFYQNPNPNTISQYNFYPPKNDISSQNSNFYPSQYQLNNPYQTQQYNNYSNNQNFYPQNQSQGQSE